MRQAIRTAGFVAPFVLLTLAGCFSLGRQTPILEQYVLGGAPAAQGAATSIDRAGLTIGLRRLDLAPYLATPAIVVRRGAQHIVTSEFHRWGEELSDGINRAVARYLAAELPIRAVDVAPWPVQSKYDYLVQLHISRFEGASPSPAGIEGEAHVAASWEIIRQQDGALLARGVTDHRERGWRVGDYAGLVSMLDQGLNALAHDLVACLASLRPAVSGTGTSGGPIANNGPTRACSERSDLQPRVSQEQLNRPE